jgi:VanZ family protein
LGALCFRGLRRGGGRLGPEAAVAVAALLAVVYGISDEAHQMYVPNRSTDVMDLVADLIGGVLGALAARSAPRLVGATGAAGPPS